MTTTAEIIELKIAVTFESDWHIGCGAGRPGEVDRLVQRDAEGFPYIPAKTLTGIWRDACELLCYGLDGSTPSAWSNWVNFLFGTQPALANGATDIAPQGAALSIRPAHFDQKLRAALQTKPELKANLTFIKPGISIDPVTGSAKPDFLRLEEIVRGRSTLIAISRLRLPEKQDQKNAALALLIASAKLVERIGGKRRRGSGKCTMSVTLTNLPVNQTLPTSSQKEVFDFDSAIKWLEVTKDPPTLPASTETLDSQNTRESNSNNVSISRVSIPNTIMNNEGWTEIPLCIKSKTPIVIPCRTIGNVIQSLDYIPGTHLLSLIYRHLTSQDRGIREKLSQAIAAGDFLVTNATIKIEEQPGRPVPFGLFAKKVGGSLTKGGVYNRLNEKEPDFQLKGERQGYVGPTPLNDESKPSHLPKHQKVNLTLNTHNTIEDESQRPTQDVGGVYSYEGISAGTELQAYVRYRTSLALDDKWKETLSSDIRLGQSKKDDFGQAELAIGKFSSIKLLDHVKEQSQLPKYELTVWLLSDLLLRDERLRPTAHPEVLAQELVKQLKPEGTELKLELKPDNETALSFLARQRRIDSWQVRWGLPRPSLVGLAAGSCIVFEVTGNIDPVKLADLELSGLGERRAEGFGQLCFNDPLLVNPTSNLEPQKGKNNSSPASNNQNSILIGNQNEDLYNYARVIEISAWRQAIQRKAIAIASDPEQREKCLGLIPKKVPKTTSQLGTLRSVINQLHSDHLNDEESNPVTRWIKNIKHIKGNADRRNKWNDQCLEKIHEISSIKENIWKILALDASDILITDNEATTIKEELWAEAIKTLFEACVRAHKRESEEVDKNNQVSQKEEQVLVASGGE